jgi:phage baseplate assembly protein W
MDGVNAADGKRLGGMDHLRQSLRDILTTPLGTRVMRRDYGSRLYQLVDAPMNRGTVLQLFAATAQAVRKWEPRFKLTKVSVASAQPGAVELELTGTYLPDGKEVTVDGIVVN